MEIQGQIINNEQDINIINMIKEKYDIDINNVSIVHLGIQAAPGSYFKINNNEIEIGITGIYELINSNITFLSSKQSINYIIDYVIEIE